MPQSELDHHAPSASGLGELSPHAIDMSADDGPALGIAVHLHSLPALIVEVTGDLDALTAPRLLEALRSILREPCPVLIIDLSTVEFMGSAALSVLVEIHEDTAADLSLRIVAPSRATRRPLQVTGLDTMLSLYLSRFDALIAPADPARRTST